MLVAIMLIRCKGREGNLRGRFHCRDCQVVGAQAIRGAYFRGLLWMGIGRWLLRYYPQRIRVQVRARMRRERTRVVGEGKLLIVDWCRCTKRTTTCSLSWLNGLPSRRRLLQSLCFFKNVQVVKELLEGLLIRKESPIGYG